LHHAPDQNELALVPGSTWSEIWWSLESGQNPPLHRLLVTTLAPPGLEVALGRALSFVGSLLSFYLAWKLLRPRGELPALVALAVLATSPAAVEAGTMYRSYGLWLPLALLHLDALQRGKLGQLAIAAVLMVQLHYTAPLYLLFLGGGWAAATGNRKLLFAHFPAVISLTPLLPFIFGDAPLRTPGGPGYLPGSLVQLLSGGTWIGLPLLAGLAWPLWRSGDRKPLLPLLSAAVMTLIVTPLALLTRSATTFALPGLILLIASCWTQLPQNRPLRYITYSFIFIQLLFCFLLIGEATRADGATSLAIRLRSKPSTAMVWVYPPHAVPALGWALLGHMPEPAACPSPTPCLSIGDLQLSGYVPGRVEAPPVLFVLGSDHSLCAEELERGRGWIRCQTGGSKRVPE
jgi:hypothetical protein